MADQDNSVIYQGNLIELHREKVPLVNAHGHTWFDIVKHPGGAVIAALDDDNRICLLKQWRHAVQKTIWELPAGCLEPNEPPLLTAQRELEEEAGVLAENWHALGEIIPSPGFSNEILYAFRATNLSSGVTKLDDAEQLEAHWLPLNEVIKMAQNGEIEDAKTLAVLLRLI